MSSQSERRFDDIPKRGKSPEEIQRTLGDAQRHDADWRNGRLQSFTYSVGEDVIQVALDAYALYYPTNALLTHAFPSLRQLEDDILSMTAGLLHAPAPLGIVTSGGTESNLLAVLSARERARRECPEITDPEIVVPESAHPSFDKAAHLFDLKVTRVPMTDELLADPNAMANAVTDRTILMSASAPTDTNGMVDRIEELAPIAAERGIPFHVDACVGGYFLPFLERLGEPVPLWDFRVPGVTSVSADLHKHGYTPKGASVIMYRAPESRGLNEFAFSDWPSGLYRSYTLVGTRPGGAVAAAWAVMNYLGEEGYCRIVKKAMEITRAMIDGINEIPGLEVWGKTTMNKFGYGSHMLDIYAIATGMEQRGWFIDLQEKPPGINMHLYPIHEPTVGPYLRDLADVTRLVAKGEIRSSGKRAHYN